MVTTTIGTKTFPLRHGYTELDTLVSPPVLNPSSIEIRLFLSQKLSANIGSHPSAEDCGIIMNELLISKITESFLVFEVIAVHISAALHVRHCNLNW